ncbi:hypothetical protein OG413_35135 [Streptomyces sp. NBC_01433]|uniref:hypothetical protein n=1 Tax=Streptomyces sp. NBC_01433 TaxID=2903864 RepID=UPI00225A4AEF|nr:hypothetical protein [Streptomyces sp. NBC_01433]MCX4680454.1 hypothetical protein [Streptomyces sp. NBC_01433]
MDQYDRRQPRSGQQPAQDSTPIYDRLVAEWRAAGRNPAAAAPHEPPVCHGGGFVPAARTSDEVAGT